MKRLFLMLGLMISISFLASCASRFPIMGSYDVVELKLNKSHHNAASQGKGKDCVPIVLGFQFSNPSILRAEERALQEAGGDLLRDKHVYFGVENDIMFVKDLCYWVEGSGVKL